MVRNILASVERKNEREENTCRRRKLLREKREKGKMKISVKLKRIKKENKTHERIKKVRKTE